MWFNCDWTKRKKKKKICELNSSKKKVEESKREKERRKERKNIKGSKNKWIKESKQLILKLVDLKIIVLKFLKQKAIGFKKNLCLYSKFD